MVQCTHDGRLWRCARFQNAGCCYLVHVTRQDLEEAEIRHYGLAVPVGKRRFWIGKRRVRKVIYSHTTRGLLIRDPAGSILAVRHANRYAILSRFSKVPDTSKQAISGAAIGE